MCNKLKPKMEQTLKNIGLKHYLILKNLSVLPFLSK